MKQEPKKKICVICGQEFWTTKTSVCCSDKCRTERMRLQMKEVNARRKKADVIHKQCAWCGKEFDTTMKHKTTCSDECNHALNKFRDRQRYEREKAQRVPKDVKPKVKPKAILPPKKAEEERLMESLNQGYKPTKMPKGYYVLSEYNSKAKSANKTYAQMQQEETIQMLRNTLAKNRNS